MRTREIGLEVIALGGGRHKATDMVDARVGYSCVAQRGQRVERGDLLAVVHAADEQAAELARGRLLNLVSIGEQPVEVASPMLERVIS